jgi:hypothetical protein
MIAGNKPDPETPNMASEALYQEEVFTDRQVGTIRCLNPVTAEGTADASRSAVYLGQTQILTPAGALPINFEIEAGSLKEAVEKFSEAAKVGIEDTLKQLEEMRREASSSIVVPGADGGFGPAGGKIQVP